MHPNRVGSLIFVSLLGIIGFLLPQQFSGVQRLQAVFIAADEQLALNDECEPISSEALASISAKYPSSCQFIVRARDLYEGRGLSEAREAFEKDRYQDQLKFAALGLLLGLLILLVLRAAGKLLIHVSPGSR